MDRNSEPTERRESDTHPSTNPSLLAGLAANLDFRSIWHSIVAAEQLSFHRAAVVLGVNQSVVSRKIRGLEDQLGVSLFERHHAGVRLTRAGTEFICQARASLNDLDYAMKSARNAGIGSRGSLRIGFLCSLASGFLRELVTEFARAHEAVAIELSYGARPDHLRQIRDRRIDIAFFTGMPELVDCEAEVWWHERVFCVLPAKHPLALAHAVDWSDIRAERFIVSRDEPGPDIHDYLIKRLARLGVHPNVRRLCVCRESLIHLVGMGFGATLTTESTTATPFRDVAFRPIVGQGDMLPCVGVWSPSNDNPALRRFVSLARILKRARTDAPSGQRREPSRAI
ncbi:LysR substrate-binding domain-containing protein [Mesorhizobium koreense]|uniref:LysR substrate-binding domain-containing protein n=1 Tax=Mesorhizobium koreense TaxID=3074855 RepID=UPI00287BAB0E|nr:LysR substrate-binding domain-containing protein [Mesorhizobium sp. WR6]